MTHSKKASLNGRCNQSEIAKIGFIALPDDICDASNNETNKAMHIISDPAKLEAGLLKAIDGSLKNDQQIRICIVSQAPKQAIRINEDLMRR